MGGIISSIGSFLGANSRAQAAKGAANAQAEGYTSARDVLTDYLGKANAFMQPYARAGSGAVNNLAAALQPGGNLNTPFTFSTTGPNADPSYIWRLNQGLDAVNKSAAARGGYFSGQTGIDLNNYAQNAASTEYGNQFNRNLVSNNSLYNMLMGLTDVGQNAAGTMGDWTQGTGGGIANTYVGTGNARARGYLNAGNAWGGMYQNIGENLGHDVNNFLAYMTQPGKAR